MTRTSPNLPPRIMCADTGTAWRGGQRQVALLAAGLHRRGVSVHLWTIEGSPLVAWANSHRIPVSTVPVPHDLAIGAARHFRRVSFAWGATVLHAHDARAHAIARTAQVFGARAVRLPLVVTRRVTRRPRGRWKYRTGVSRYIAISSAVRDSLVRAGVPAARIAQIPSAVRTPLPTEPTADLRRWGIGPEARVVLILGALSPEKGVATGIAAASRPGTPGIRWVIAGDGPERERLEQLARRLGAPVTFTGFIDDPGPLLRRADLLVHTPLSEGLGGAVLDALVRGRPVVATDTGGLREIVRPETGTLVPPRDPAAVAAAVASWLDNDEQRRRVQALAPKICGRHGADLMATRTMEIYETLNR